jgi:hypothetical protein
MQSGSCVSPPKLAGPGVCSGDLTQETQRSRNGLRTDACQGSCSHWSQSRAGSIEVKSYIQWCGGWEKRSNRTRNWRTQRVRERELKCLWRARWVPESLYTLPLIRPLPFGWKPSRHGQDGCSITPLEKRCQDKTFYFLAAITEVSIHLFLHIKLL